MRFILAFIVAAFGTYASHTIFFIFDQWEIAFQPVLCMLAYGRSTGQICKTVVGTLNYFDGNLTVADGMFKNVVNIIELSSSLDIGRSVKDENRQTHRCQFLPTIKESEIGVVGGLVCEAKRSIKGTRNPFAQSKRGNKTGELSPNLRPRY